MQGEWTLYYNDEPIKNKGEDLLNRHGFASKLAKMLVELDTLEGFCIGLYGSWGSGKTSLINMICDELATEPKMNVIRFNPWNVTSSDQLLRQFFALMIDHYIDSGDKYKKEIGDAIKQYANCLDLIPNVGPYARPIVGLLGDRISSKSIGNMDIDKQRRVVSDKLGQQQSRCLLIIDDIDRLSNDQIRLIFQLVNSVAKFPNIIYFLAFDKDIVARALYETQKVDGNVYLEKIIQVPIELPEVHDDRLWAALFKRLDSIIADYPHMHFDEKHWGEVFNTIVIDAICNVRDVNRLSNSLRFRASMIADDVDYADLVAITVIAIKHHDLYDWIKNNRDALTGRIGAAINDIGLTDDAIRKKHEEEVQRISANNGEKNKKIVQLLFPLYKCGRYSYAIPSNDELIRKLSIGHPDMMERYFSLEIMGNALSRLEVDKVLFDYNEDELRTIIKKVNTEDKTISLLNEINAARKDLAPARAKVLIRVITELTSSLRGKKEGLFSVSAISLAEYVVENLISTLPTSDERMEILKEIIDAASEENIEAICILVNSEELAHGRLAANGNARGDAILENQQLDLCEMCLRKAINRIAENANYINASNYRMTLYMFECLDKPAFDSYMKLQLESDENKLKLLAMSAVDSRVISSQYAGRIEWSYKDDYKEYFTDEDILKTINEAINEGTLFNLSAEDINRVIAFKMLKVSKTPNSRECVNDTDVKNYIQRLKK